MDEWMNGWMDGWMDGNIRLKKKFDLDPALLRTPGLKIKIY